MRHIPLATLLFAAGALLLPAQSVEQRARLYNHSGSKDKCTVEVQVNGAAEVEIAGDSGILRTLSGGPAAWRRFECTAPLPLHPENFRFVGVDGRGRQYLAHDPRGRGEGVAVVRIEDFRRGREGYTFDLEWEGAGTGVSSRLYESPYTTPPTGVTACQEAITDRLTRTGYGTVRFGSTEREESVGRDDAIVGTVHAGRGWDTRLYSYSCLLDSRSGRVRDTDLHLR